MLCTATGICCCSAHRSVSTRCLLFEQACVQEASGEAREEGARTHHPARTLESRGASLTSGTQPLDSASASGSLDSATAAYRAVGVGVVSLGTPQRAPDRLQICNVVSADCLQSVYPNSLWWSVDMHVCAMIVYTGRGMAVSKHTLEVCERTAVTTTTADDRSSSVRAVPFRGAKRNIEFLQRGTSSLPASVPAIQLTARAASQTTRRRRARPATARPSRSPLSHRAAPSPACI